GSGSALFNAPITDTFAVRRSREMFERYFVPGFTILLMLLQATLALWLWRWLQKTPALPLAQPLVALGLFAIFFLALFLLGKYSAGLPRIDDHRLLRHGGNYRLFGAYFLD